MEAARLHAERERIRRQIQALEQSLGAEGGELDLAASSSDDDTDDSDLEIVDVAGEDLAVERQRVEREIQELEQALSSNAAAQELLSDDENSAASWADGREEDSDEELDLPQNVDTCLQLNLVYQQVLKEKLLELERLLKDNQQQQKDIEVQMSGPTTPNPSLSGLPPLKLFLGNFMRPYFKDKVTSLGPPANPETKEKMAAWTKTCDEKTIRRWEGWQKTLLVNAVVQDSMKRLIQPKMSKIQYMKRKMPQSDDMEKQILEKQICEIEREISNIRSMNEEELVGDRTDEHDWEKIANIDFEGTRQGEDLKRFWQNYLHPSVNKTKWNQDEIDKLKQIVEEHHSSNWELIAHDLGTNRTAFMCFQTHQRYVCKEYRKRPWTKEEDKVLRYLVEKMRIGNFIPYTQVSYFMANRDSAQVMYRWTMVLDPSLKKGPWSKEEDELLLKAIEKHGIPNWFRVKFEVPGRTDGQCRDRYLDCLCESVKKGVWDIEEEEMLRRAVARHGIGKWSKISSEVPGRTDSQCLQKWKTLTKVTLIHRRKKTVPGVKPVRKRTYTQRRKTNRRKAKRRVVKKNLDAYSPSSDEENIKMEFMDSDDEKSESNRQPEDPVELEPPEPDYIQTPISEWIPKPSVKLGILRTVLFNPPKPEAEKSQSILPFPQRRYTILDRNGSPVNTFVSEDTGDLKTRIYEDEMLKVPYNDVVQYFTYLRDSIVREMRQRAANRLNPGKQCGQTRAANSNKQQEHSPSARGPKRPVRHGSTMNLELQIAISPWVGSVVLPLPAFQTKNLQADVIRKRAAHASLSSTSVFLLFLKILHIDIVGCRKIIDCRNNKPVLPPASMPKAPVKSSHRTTPTVADILYNQRVSEFLRKTQTQSRLVEPSQLLPVTSQKACLVIPNAIPQPVMRAQSPNQPAPSTASEPDTPRVSCKRQRKPTEKMKELMKTNMAKSKAAKSLSPEHKKPRMLLSGSLTSPEDKKHHMLLPAPVPSPVTWILAPSGLVPVTTGDGISGVPCIALPTPVVNQVNPVLLTLNAPEMDCPSTPLASLVPAVTNALGVQQTSEKSVGTSVGSTAQLVTSVDGTQKTPPADQKSRPANNAATSNLTLSVCNKSSIPQVASEGNNHGEKAVTMALVSSDQATCHNVPVVQETSEPVVQAFTPVVNIPNLHFTASANPQAFISIFDVSGLSGPTSATSSQPSGQVTTSAISMLAPTPLNVPVVQSSKSVMISPLVSTVTTLSSSQGTTTTLASTSSQQTSTLNLQGNTSVLSIPTVQRAAPVSEVVAVTSATLSTVSVTPSSSGSRMHVHPLVFNISPKTMQPSVAVQSLSLSEAPPPSTNTVSASSVLHSTSARKLTRIQPHPQLLPLSSSMSSLDQSLLFLEGSAEVRCWAAGKGGITLPELDTSMPYLPPFVSNINTFQGLLSVKDTLLKNALQLLPLKSVETEEEQIAILRNMVSTKFSSNPAYLLLKARFLSCFTLPAFLASLHPQKLNPLATNGNENEEALELSHGECSEASLLTTTETSSGRQISGLRNRCPEQ
ncbi:snRNA-activating protein complex subunit 4-like [Denticeps clupeoides]|uniref:snRNA-activating protein complex subunit 4-like n=1 Tax=Denticeps clupeoides TaxID=299321 RepID=UPI0010A2ED20|nr:snRNA-activating protein complex subunit 4-like [Denticeps clupeoides]